MSLFQKALKYRENFLDTHVTNSSLGLLNRALSFLYLKDSEEINLDDAAIIAAPIFEKKQFLQKKSSEGEFEESDNNSAVKNYKENAYLDLSKYYDTIYKISTELSKLLINKDSYDVFNKIIVNNFNFSKNALLIYSPTGKKFIHCSSSGLDAESIDKLSFDIGYNNIYKKMVTENSFMINKDTPDFSKQSDIISENDLKESDFQLYIPFILSGHVIGIFLGLKLIKNSKPEKELINSLEIIGRLNGALLYNILQNVIVDEAEEKKKEFDSLDSANFAEKIEKSGIDISKYFENRLHKLIFYARESLKKQPGRQLTILHFIILDKSENIDSVKLTDFYSDIQFIIMNIAGAYGFVELFKDLDAYVILPEIKKDKAKDIFENIKIELTKLLVEVFEDIKIEVKETIISYPDDADNYIDLFLKARII